MGDSDDKKAIHVDITMPSDWLAAFKKAAKAAGQSLSEWIGAAARKALPPEQRKKLTERKGRGRPSKSDDGDDD